MSRPRRPTRSRATARTRALERRAAEGGAAPLGGLSRSPRHALPYRPAPFADHRHSQPTYPARPPALFHRAGETQLAEAIPILESALKAVGNLSKNDINEVKALKKPPDGVRLTIEALCIMFGVKPEKVPNPAGKGPKVDDYWGPGSKEILGNSKLLEDLKGYDSDNIPVEVITKITPYISRPDFAEDVIARGSVAAGGLCKWVHAVFKYDKVAKIVAPKKAALAKAIDELNSAMSVLAVKQAMVKELKDKLAQLESDLAGAIARKNSLIEEVETCKTRLDRANKLVSGLGGEKVRWTASAQNLQVLYDNIVGDVVLSAGMIAYLGAFTAAFRDECIAEWSKMLTSKRIPCAAAFKLNACLGDAVAVRNWVINKLPNDSFSVDNAIMMTNSGRWPLCIDPQRQANKWIRNSEAARGLKVVKQSQATFVRTIESAIQFGNPVLLENVPESLDPVLEPLLARQLVKVGGAMTIRLGDSTVEYDMNFKLYITTVLPNPHYAPETCVKVNLLNFMATSEGLQDQMLGIVVKTERPELEEQREKLVLEDAENKRILKELEDRILFLLANSKGNILDDGELISTLADSKVTSNQIMKAVEVAERTVAKIATARLGYVPVARRASMLFFCIADLSSVDPMYQYSLEFYIRLFLLAIEKAPKPDAPESKTAAAMAAMLEKRIQALKDTFTTVLYENICRSLFEKDKLLFSFLLASKVMSGDGKLDLGEVRFFLQGSLSMALRRPNPVTAAGGSWLSDKQWADILDLARQPSPVFKDLELRLEKDIKGWEQACASADPLTDFKELINGGPSGDLSAFQALMVLRCVSVRGGAHFVRMRGEAAEGGAMTRPEGPRQPARSRLLTHQAHLCNSPPTHPPTHTPPPLPPHPPTRPSPLRSCGPTRSCPRCSSSSRRSSARSSSTRRPSTCRSASTTATRARRSSSCS